MPAIVSVGFYFDKRRSFAIGIAVCGTGVGTFLLSPTNRKLTNWYGWQGALLIKAAFVLNVVICGLVMRPLPVEPAEILKNKRERRRALEKSSSISSEKQGFIEPDFNNNLERIQPSIFISAPNLDKGSSKATTDLGNSLQCIDMDQTKQIKKVIFIQIIYLMIMLDN